MKNEPLENKIVVMNPEDLYSDFEEKNFTYSDVKSAVELLRDRSCMRRGCKYRKETSKIKIQVFMDKCPQCEIIDKTFPDVIEGI